MNHKRVQLMFYLVTFLLSPYALFAQPTPSHQSNTIKVKVVDNLIVMPGYVNGSGRLNVVLDTGTGGSLNILSPDCASKLNLISTGAVKAAGIGEGQDETLHLLSNEQLSWGTDKQLSLDNQHIAELPIAYISRQTGYPVDGIFGSSLFAHFDIRVDYERGLVTFGPESTSPATGTPIPIKLYGMTPFVQATIETVEGKAVSALFLVDSGTTAPLVLSSKFLDAHPSIAQGHDYHDVPPITAVGGVIDMKLLRITGLDLGPFHLTAPVASVPREAVGVLANPAIAGFIGAGILSRFIVDWNYGHMTMTLTPNHRYGAPFETDASGLRLVAEKPDWKKIFVAAVSPGTPAAKAGVEAGDILIEVNGKRPPPLYRLQKLLDHPGNSVSVTVLRSGKTQRMMIHLRRLT